MATITQKQWKRYTSRLRQINEKAAEEFKKTVIENGGYENIERQKLIDYAYGVSTKYGEASAALSAEMYDSIAELSNARVPAAVPVEINYHDVAKTVNGIIKNTANEDILAQGVGRLVKMAGTDTVLSNAHRDKPKGSGSKRKHSGAQVAWVPIGDTCPFCLMLASKGWMYQTEWGSKSHSEHIHANCDCTYAVRFDEKSGIDGYDPDEYKKMYEEAEGSTRNEKFNSMRRDYYDENKDKINAQKRALYQKEKESNNQTEDNLKSKKQLLSLDITNLSDEFIGKSVGAKSNNYDIMDLATGEVYHLAEGTYLRDKEVFAGKGTKTEYRIAEKYAEKYGGKVEDWQHVKGKGTLSTPDGDRNAEIHWSQCEGIGKKDLNVKKWMD